VLLPVSVLLSYSVLPCQNSHCWMFHEHQQTISMRINVPEWTHVLLVNTPCTHLHETSVSSGLAVRVTFTRVSRERLRESVIRGWTCFWFNFCTVICDCFWVTFWMARSALRYPILLSHRMHEFYLQLKKQIVSYTVISLGTLQLTVPLYQQPQVSSLLSYLPSSPR
jgi:hypothetical protein